MRPPHRVLIAAIVVALSFAAARTARAQGCVAIRPMGCSSSQSVNPSILLLEKGEWQARGTYQYFRSFRHFRGDEEEANRVEDGTEVINISHALDVGIGYGLTNRFALTLNVPLLYYNRSSLYEHYGNSVTRNPDQLRFETGSYGIGDMRLTASSWMLDPMMPHRGNVSFGLGVKAPTGNSNVQDDFHKMAADGSDSLATRAVDQSIQLGDSGWGFAVGAEGYRALFSRTSLFFNGFYLFNPKKLNEENGYSVADQYAARLGFDYLVSARHGFSASLAGRWEGIPAEDVFGDSHGRRRPGYAVSIEPGIFYQRNAVTFSLNVPIAVYRNRTQSVRDKERTEASGEWVQGDAAFADYLVNFTITTQFGKTHHMMDPMDQLEQPGH